ncbi:MAG: hypothetical protein EXR75_11930 [Myxococcales bacterium]|nr:hypothetical protein [Myxococcales bacterium]
MSPPIDETHHHGTRKRVTTLARSSVAVCLALMGCSSADPSAPAETPTVVDTGHPPKSGPPQDVVGGFAIAIPDEVLAPGVETHPCYIFPLELEGPSRIVGGGRLTTGPGMHHGNVTTRPKTGEGLRPCGPEEGGQLQGEAIDVSKGGAVVFGSSTQFVGEEWSSFPDGMGYRIKEGFEIVARMHFVNTSSKEVTVSPRYDWFTIDETKVTQVLGPFAWALGGFELPPLSTSTAQASCPMLGPMHLVNVLPHMHALGTHFFAEHLGGPQDGERFLDSVGYDPDNGVMTQYTPAVDLSETERFVFGCTWQNTFDKSIVEGTGDNEMCILFGYGYPAENAYSATASPHGCVTIAPP